LIDKVKTCVSIKAQCDIFVALALTGLTQKNQDSSYKLRNSTSKHK